MLRVRRALLKEDGKELKVRFPEITVWKEGGNITLISDPSSAKSKVQKNTFTRKWIFKKTVDQQK